MKASWQPYTLYFTFEAGTSRGVLKEKDTYFLFLTDKDGNQGIGECSPLWGLSPDDWNNYEEILQYAIDELSKIDRFNEEGSIYSFAKQFQTHPSIRMGIETALLDLYQPPFQIFSSEFLSGSPISINGLVWMGDIKTMKKRALKKIKQGFRTIKIKIGALEFDKELSLLWEIQSANANLVLRVDANGGFSVHEIKEVLNELKRLDIHSIEQPIAPGNIDEMARLCSDAIIPIALDEELISCKNKRGLLEQVNPQYIVLKPSLLGGFDETLDWIKESGRTGTGWWITSALESNIGLNAIAQFTSRVDNGMVHGLGTGILYSNNIQSPLEVKEGYIWYNRDHHWNLDSLN